MYDDIYKDYNHERYAHFRNMKSGEYTIEKFKSSSTGSRVKPIVERVKIPFEEVRDLNLDKYGSVVPTLDTEDFTIVSNYLIDFWGSVMGNCAVDTYLHLKRHAYGKKDYCYVDIGLIALKMKRSKNTVKKYLETLEDYGFIAIFHRFDKENDNRDVSPLFKIRRYIPMITEEMYNKMDSRLKELHDSFMKGIADVNMPTMKHNTSSVIEDIVSNGKLINNKDNQNEIDKRMAENAMKSFIIDTLNINQITVNDLIHDEIKKDLSKPMYDSWFANIIFLTNSEDVIALCPNSESSDVLSHYKDRIIDISSCSNLISSFYNEYIERKNRVSN